MLQKMKNLFINFLASGIIDWYNKYKASLVIGDSTPEDTVGTCRKNGIWRERIWYLMRGLHTKKQNSFRKN